MIIDLNFVKEPEGVHEPSRYTQLCNLYRPSRTRIKESCCSRFSFIRNSYHMVSHLPKEEYLIHVLPVFQNNNCLDLRKLRKPTQGYQLFRQKSF